MPDKLILKVHKCGPRTGQQNVIKVTGEAMQILESWQRVTGYPLKQLASKMITFASERIEVENEE